MKRVKFIYNPRAGETAITDKLDAIIEVYQNKGYSVTPYRLTFNGKTEEITHDLHNYEHILIAGGDGTVNYVVNILQNYNIDIPIALLSAGTANDFASLVGTAGDPVKACREILSGVVQKIDLGHGGGKHFINVFSCGLFTEVSQKTPTLMKNTFGKLAYYVGGLGELPNFHWMNIKITSDGGNFDGKCLIFFVLNGRTAGKIKIARDSQLDDGLLDVVIFRGFNPLETIFTAFKVLTSLPLERDTADIVSFKCSKLLIECPTQEPTDVDGQPGPEFPIEISCKAAVQKVIFPKRKR